MTTKSLIDILVLNVEQSPIMGDVRCFRSESGNSVVFIGDVERIERIEKFIAWLEMLWGGGETSFLEKSRTNTGKCVLEVS